ncbi:MAG: hypothetical protein AAGA48_30540 [Myxococcota bacterium]
MLIPLFLAATVEASAPIPDPLTLTPFPFQEVARIDERPSGSVTRRTLAASPAVPFTIGTSTTGAFIGQVRQDRIMGAQGLQDLYRVEVGVPWSTRISPRVALDFDARVVWADRTLGGVGSLYPNLRAGFTWTAGPRGGLSAALLYTHQGFGVAPLPVVGGFWRSGRWRFDLLLPRYAELAMRASPGFELFSAAHWEWSIWSADAEAKRRYRVRQEGRLHLGARTAISGPLFLETAVLWTPLQTYDDGDEVVRGDPNDLALSVSLVFDRNR